MTSYDAGFSKKAQLKIQQMAFVLVALMIFFSLVALVFLSIWLSDLKGNTQELKDKEALEIIRKISGTPEFTFTSSSDCSSCIDLDKVIMAKSMDSYQNLFNLDYLLIERVYPPATGGECTRSNYPNCNQITIIKKTEDYGLAPGAFVTLASWSSEKNSFKYEIGRIYASGYNNEK
ncbi:MAG: hypothetical protein AABX73_02870 [Nanoarchaeota archaeon]